MKRLHLYPKHNFIQTKQSIFTHTDSLRPWEMCFSKLERQKYFYLFLPLLLSSFRTHNPSHRPSAIRETWIYLSSWCLWKDFCAFVWFWKESTILSSWREDSRVQLASPSWSRAVNIYIFFIVPQRTRVKHVETGGRCSVVCACVFNWLYQQCSGHLQTLSF